MLFAGPFSSFSQLSIGRVIYSDLDSMMNFRTPALGQFHIRISNLRKDFPLL
jgi:hypothetical protein